MQGAEWTVIRGPLHQKAASVQKRTEGTEVLWMKMGEVTLGEGNSMSQSMKVRKSRYVWKIAGNLAVLGMSEPKP